MRRRRGELDVIVVGAGISGLTAAYHCARMGLAVGIVECELPGGLVVNVGKLDGYPSASPTSGAELATGLYNEAAELGVQIINGEVTDLNLNASPMIVRAQAPAPASTETHTATELKTRSVVLAMGASLLPLTVPGAERLWGRGISQCAFCDAGLFRGEKVAVVGGGDSALQEALHLTAFASEISLIHRGNRLSARQHYTARAAEAENIRFHWSSKVIEILGNDSVEGLRIASRDGEEIDIACRAVFPFVGLQPRMTLLPASLVRQGDAVRVDDSLATSLPGVYAVGALRSGFAGQLTNAVSDGSVVAQSIAVDFS